ncbi:nicotinate phosphoribosyltransferase isoform X4 [Ursus arctos]|uniref:nicotinate phosphoribosyltransferase isoform X4 n=1 Tax=Ursus arctos TaxID=9644 RepID=UPI000E6E048E|nr:nicotinate phosphoribosyltransferase isoform X4 [Ursus arctos]
MAAEQDPEALAAARPLLTDLYQATMALGYWRAGRAREQAEFELFFRGCPFGGAFALAAGLRDCVRFLRAFRLRDADVQFLASVLPPDTEPAFFEHLRGLDCSDVTVRALPEGSLAFPGVPLLQVCGPLLVVQLLETPLLCLVSYASLIATNAARLRLIAGPKKRLLEMGLRRAQGPDGGLTASTYSYLGGFDGSSNVLAGQLRGVPVAGTLAHSFITSFLGTEVPPNPAQEIRKIFRTISAQFQVPWLESVSITVSNNINEEELARLAQEGSEVNVIGIGTNVVTCPRQPSLGCVYKLVSVGGQPRMKLTEDPEKQTLPGSKAAFRLLGADGEAPPTPRGPSQVPRPPALFLAHTGSPLLDVLQLVDEPPPQAGQELRVWPRGAQEACTVRPAHVEPLLRLCVRRGQLCEPLPSLAESRAFAQLSLSRLSPEHKRLEQPAPYRVALSDKLRALVDRLCAGGPS